MISYYIPNLILITADESSYHLSSKPVFTANGGHSRKPQLDIQNSTDGGEHGANRDIRITATASVAKGTWRERVESVLEQEHQNVCAETVSPRMAVLDKVPTF